MDRLPLNPISAFVAHPRHVVTTGRILGMGGGLRVERRLEDEEGGGQRSQSYANYRKRIIGLVTAELYINATQQTF